MSRSASLERAPQALVRWTGPSEAWTSVPSGTSWWLYAIAGRGPDDVWAARDTGTLLHWNGIAWEDRSRNPGDTTRVTTRRLQGL